MMRNETSGIVLFISTIAILFFAYASAPQYKAEKTKEQIVCTPSTRTIEDKAVAVTGDKWSVHIAFYHCDRGWTVDRKHGSVRFWTPHPFDLEME